MTAAAPITAFRTRKARRSTPTGMLDSEIEVSGNPSLLLLVGSFIVGLPGLSRRNPDRWQNCNEKFFLFLIPRLTARSNTPVVRGTERCPPAFKLRKRIQESVDVQFEHNGPEIARQQSGEYSEPVASRLGRIAN